MYDAAPQAYSAVAGSERGARAALEQLWRTPGHSASFEHALVAELDGRVVGVLIGFAARDRYRLHFALLRMGFRYVSMRRCPLLRHAAQALVHTLAVQTRAAAALRILHEDRLRMICATVPHGHTFLPMLWSNTQTV